MADVIRYGQTSAEELAQEKEICRQIVSEISQFGVSQRQQLFIIYLLAMELEDVEKMQVLTSVIRDIGADDLFLVDRAQV